MAWVWCWLLTTSFTLVIQFVAPTWIMPLFNKFTPLDEGELRDAVMDYAKEVRFPLEGALRDRRFTPFDKGQRLLHRLR